MNANVSGSPSSTSPGQRPAPTRSVGTLRTVMLTLLAATAIACLVASAVHFGFSLAAGPLRVEEPPILPAAIVEGAIGIALSVAGVALLMDAPGAREAALAACALGVLGFLVGIAAVARDPGLQTPFNVGVHAGVFPLLVVGLVLTLSPAGRRALTPAGRAA